jgi:hypothetical protein
MAATERRSRSQVRPEEDAAVKRRLEDPEIQRKLREVREIIESDSPLDPGLGPDQLPDFLRERE